MKLVGIKDLSASLLWANATTKGISKRVESV